MYHIRPDYARIQDPDKKIPENEPVFLLRGQDTSAPETVRFWAVYNAAHGGSLAASFLALKQAVHMEKWQKECRGKPCDLPGE